MSEKQYLNMCAIKEKVFDNGGSLINCSFKLEELEKIVNEQGWVNITIAKRRQADEKGKTHYAYVNDYKPKPKPVQQEVVDLPLEEDIPFFYE